MEDKSENIVPFIGRTEGKILDGEIKERVKAIIPGARAYVDLDYKGGIPKRFFIIELGEVRQWDLDFEPDNPTSELARIYTLDILYENSVPKKEYRRNDIAGFLLFLEDLVLKGKKNNVESI